MTVSRRRFLMISAASVLAAECGFAAPARVWRGRAMGAEASMAFYGLEERAARRLYRAVEREVARLERIFSLHLPHSELSSLNRAGRLKAPAPELVDTLRLCDDLHRVTGGAFDPSVQPMWRTLTEAGTSVRDVARARALVGWQRVRFDTDEIRLVRPGMALTLNGIAQGVITDRIAALLKRRGLSDVLIDMGEVAALGRKPDGTAWTAGIARPDGRLVERVRLQDRALATSAPEGTILDAKTRTGHILDPRGLEFAPRHTLVSISGPSAAIADGLSTAGCLMGKAALDRAVAAFPDTRLETLI